MRKYKVLNIISVVSLATFLPYVILDRQDFFYGKSQNLDFPMLFMFLVTFVCSFAIMTKASNSNVKTEFSLSDLKLIDKPLIPFVVSSFVVGNVLNFLFVKNGSKWFYLIFSGVCSAFVCLCNILIKKIKHSTFFKVKPPFYFYAFPFMIVLATVALHYFDIIYVTDNMMLTAFIAYAILLMIVLWVLPVFTVDELLKTICNSTDGLNLFISFFRGEQKDYSLDNVRCVRKTNFFYIIEFNENTLKIPRLYSNTKDLLNILENTGIIITEL